MLWAEGPVVDFDQDNGWVVAGKAVFIFAFLVVLVLLTVWGERRVVGRMQSRPGPNRTGPFGVLQCLADGVKLMLKEDIVPKAADRIVFILAPFIATVTCFLAFAMIPFGPDARIPFTDITTPLQLTDLPIAVLFILAAASVGVYGIVLGGWSSGSTYPLLGGLRSSAQVISYELAMTLALVPVFLVTGSMSTSAIVDHQASMTVTMFGREVSHMPSWNIVLLFPSFVLYVIAMVGETNRAPFDLPEAEGELVGGFHTEYSSMKFALYFLAEYVNLITVSAIATTLFLGGWRAPWPISIWDGANQGWWPMLWFVSKLCVFIFVFIWLRGTLPRLRYDQFMAFGWKRLIPLGLVWVTLVALYKGFYLFKPFTFDRGLALPIAGVVFAIAVGSMVWPYVVGVPEPEPEPAPAPIDPFAGGFPVPALPGQTLVRTNGRTPVPAGAAVGTTIPGEAAGSQEVQGG